VDIIVCIKQVPDPRLLSKMKIDENGRIDRTGIPGVLGPPDKSALEEALKIKERFGGEITVFSMGPPQAIEVCRDALAFGADESILICDISFAGSDTLATSYVLACAISKIKFDIVLCGNETIDSGTGQVPPQLAEFLRIPHITGVRKIEFLDESTVEVESRMESDTRIVRARVPALIGVTKGINDPHIPSAFDIMNAFKKKIIQWNIKDIGADADMVGSLGSPTFVERAIPMEQKREGLISGDLDEAVGEAVNRLKRFL